MSARVGERPRRERLRPPAHTSRFLEVATLRDAAAVAALRCATADRLTAEHGEGPWSGQTSATGMRSAMARAVVYVHRERGAIVATFALSPRKPWAIDPAYFTAARVPLYLTSMAVRPDRQRAGLGRRCMRELPRIARDWGADAVRLDAYDAPAGAGGFYAACGMRESGRVVYRRAPLVYYEWVA